MVLADNFVDPNATDNNSISTNANNAAFSPILIGQNLNEIVTAQEEVPLPRVQPLDTVSSLVKLESP